MIQIDYTQNITLVLSGTPTNELSFICSSIDLTGDSFQANQTNTGLSTDTTPVVLLSSPIKGFTRQVKFISVNNLDVSAQVATIQINTSVFQENTINIIDTTVTILISVTLQPGYTLTYNNEDGFIVYDTNGANQESLYYQTVMEECTALPQRPNLKFFSGLLAEDFTSPNNNCNSFIQLTQISLQNSGVYPTTYGSATQVPVINVNAKGQIISASNVAISGVPPGGAAGGDLAGTYPNPTVFQAHLTDQAAPSAPPSGTIILASFNQQGFSVAHIYDTQGNKIEVLRDNIIIVRNVSGGNMTKGQAVYVSGTTGTVPQVSLAKANSTTTLGTVLILYEDINNNNYGRAMFLGNIENYNLSAFSSGAILYVDPSTAGALTSTKPTNPNFAQEVGIVLNNGVGNGVLFVYTRGVIGVLNGDSAGGDLTGTYPNPTVANNAITTAKINNSAVTYAKIQNETNNTILGNVSGGAAAPAEISIGAWTDFSGSIALTGFAASPTINVARYLQLGKMCFFAVSVTATSNAGTHTFTIPFNAKSAIDYIGWVSDNATANSVLLAQSTASSNSVSIFKNTGGNNISSTGTVNFIISFFFEIA